MFYLVCCYRLNCAASSPNITTSIHIICMLHRFRPQNTSLLFSSSLSLGRRWGRLHVNNTGGFDVQFKCSSKPWQRGSLHNARAMNMMQIEEVQLSFISLILLPWLDHQVYFHLKKGPFTCNFNSDSILKGLHFMIHDDSMFNWTIILICSWCTELTALNILRTINRVRVRTASKLWWESKHPTLFYWAAASAASTLRWNKWLFVNYRPL